MNKNSLSILNFKEIYAPRIVFIFTLTLTDFSLVLLLSLYFCSLRIYLNLTSGIPPKLESFQLQGASPSWSLTRGLPWTPLGALPQTPDIGSLALRARHAQRSHKQKSTTAPIGSRSLGTTQPVILASVYRLSAVKHFWFGMQVRLGKH